jgi:biopolymer transport protein ExbD
MMLPSVDHKEANMASKAEPNVVPLCDVLLVLLIIFMVITPIVQKGIDVKLPETAADTSGGMPTGLIVLTVNKDATVLINQTSVEIKVLGDELRRIYSSRQDKTIFIRAYAKLPYSRVIEVIDIAKGAGVEVLGIIPEYIVDEEGT